jgi:L-ascorbate metabolism protein UlaG (beta-lactamase superfamily)
MIENLHWLGHSSFRWEGSKTIYFDPWKIAKDAKKADIILVSHEHFDHCSKVDIGMISTKETLVVTCEAAARELKPVEPFCKEVKTLLPGGALDISGVKIIATASYNLGKTFHSRDSNKLGFIVTMDGVSVYHAGDTDAIPEMVGYRCDVALLPVSGTYVMSADEAAGAALIMRPKIAVPMHYADIVGSASDARRLQELLKGKVEVRIPRKEK